MKRVIKYIGNIKNHELEENTVFICTNEEGYLSILIKNAVPKSITNQYSTDNLAIKLNSVLIYDQRDYYFHIISSKKMDYYSKEQFLVIYDYVFGKIKKPIMDYDLSALITSLEDYFKTTPDQNFKSLQIGLFGELLTIKYLYEKGYEEIIEKYHDDFYSKHDIEITSKVRLEIKTTTSERRVHEFRHDQIFRNDIDLYVASIVLEPSQEGYSLHQLFSEVITYYSNPEMIFSLKKWMKKANVSHENGGLKVSLEKAIDDIKFYGAKDLPKVEIPTPKGVSNITYDVDCTFAVEIETSDLINIFKNN